jgi:aminoacrylate hydrolase
VRYEAIGRDKSDASTIVVSAGLGGLGAYWRPQTAVLADRFHVIAYDHRGTGANAGALPDDYAISAMADDVFDVADAAGVERFHFMGHALGGLVGMEAALRAPARLGSLILVNAWARVSAPTRRCFAARLALLEHAGAEAYVRAQAIFLYPAAWLARHEERVANEEAHGIAHFQGAEVLKKRVRALLSFDASERLNEICVPTLVAATRDDVLVPYTCSELLAAGIPGAKLWLADEGGHASSVTDSAAFNTAIVGFLDDVGRASETAGKAASK